MNISTQAAHRPSRRFPNAERKVLQPEDKKCPCCGGKLKTTGNLYINREVQTMNGPLNVRAYGWRCSNSDCPRPDIRYRARRELWRISLPKFGYGLDVIAYIGWERDQKFRQFCEIQQDLLSRGIQISERHVGRLYRQYLSLLGGLNDQKLDELKKTNSLHGGVVWALDALQPDQDGTQLYVLYEAISETTVAAAWLDKRDAKHLMGWLKPITSLNLTVLATISDGEEAEIKALKTLWPDSPHQMCLTHFLGDCAKPIKKADRKLKTALREGMMPLPKVPGDDNSAKSGPRAATLVLQEPSASSPSPTHNHKAGENKSALIPSPNSGDKDDTTHNNAHTSSAPSQAPINWSQTNNPSQEKAEISSQTFTSASLSSIRTNLSDYATALKQTSDGHEVELDVTSNESSDLQYLPANEIPSQALFSLVDESNQELSSHPHFQEDSFSVAQFQIEQDSEPSTLIFNSFEPMLEAPFEPFSSTNPSFSHDENGPQEVGQTSVITLPAPTVLNPLSWPPISELPLTSSSTTEVPRAPLTIKELSILPSAHQGEHELVSTHQPQEAQLGGPTLESEMTSPYQKESQSDSQKACSDRQLRMREIEHLLRKSFQNCLKRPSRYPSTFGGLAGYQQLAALVQAMHEQLPPEVESYLHLLLAQGEQALTNASGLAGQVEESVTFLRGLTTIFFEPLSSQASEAHDLQGLDKSAAEVKKEVTDYLASVLANQSLGSLATDFIIHSQQLIEKMDSSLFNCYDIPLLPPTNAALESRFNRLRRGARRISGQKKTTELRRTAHLQLLLYASTVEELVEQFALVLEDAYTQARASLEAAEERQRQLARLRHKPYQTASTLVAEYVELLS